MFAAHRVKRNAFRVSCELSWGFPEPICRCTEQRLNLDPKFFIELGVEPRQNQLWSEKVRNLNPGILCTRSSDSDSSMRSA